MHTIYKCTYRVSGKVGTKPRLRVTEVKQMEKVCINLCSKMFYSKIYGQNSSCNSLHRIVYVLQVLNKIIAK